MPCCGCACPHPRNKTDGRSRRLPLVSTVTPSLEPIGCVAHLVGEPKKDTQSRAPSGPLTLTRNGREQGRPEGTEAARRNTAGAPSPGRMVRRTDSPLDPRSSELFQLPRPARCLEGPVGSHSGTISVINLFLALRCICASRRTSVPTCPPSAPLEQNLRFAGREDFWIMVAARSEDETENAGRAFLPTTTADKAKKSADAARKTGVYVALWAFVSRLEHSSASCVAMVGRRVEQSPVLD